jgi:hypothetical protein
MILLLTLCCFSCKNHESATREKPEELKSGSLPDKANNVVADSATGNKENPPVVTKDTTLFTLVIMFYSIGEGVENEYIKALEDSISSFSAEISKPIDYEKNSWGREGETDICMQLFELSAVEKSKFIAETKSLLKKAKWVNIYENYPYRHRSRR